MGRIGFVFAGQGDQYPGMGAELYRAGGAAGEILDTLEKLRPGTLRQCLEGTAEELLHTGVTQPCLYALELAYAARMKEQGIRPDACAGFSLGEVSAAAAAGLVDLETGFRLVCRRGERMESCARAQDTAMAAVLKLSAEQTEALCAEFPDLYPVNYNSPGQISVSGAAASMPAFRERVKACGGRTVPLKVQGAFHSPYMKEAAEGFAQDLQTVCFRTPEIPLYSDLTGAPYEGDPVRLLSRQIDHPVRWEELIRRMIGDGIRIFVEIGPGQTLSNLIKKIDPEVRVCRSSDPDSLREVFHAEP